MQLEPKQSLPYKFITSSKYGSLHISGSRLFWYRDDELFKIITIQEDISDACFSKFDLYNKICLVTSSVDTIRFFFEDGEQYLVNVPFIILKIRSLVKGILIERRMDDFEESDTIPTLFTIFHPLDEAKPVSIISDSSTGGMVGIPTSNNFNTVNTRKHGSILAVINENEASGIILLQTFGQVNVCKYDVQIINNKNDDMDVDDLEYSASLDRTSPFIIRADRKFISPMEIKYKSKISLSSKSQVTFVSNSTDSYGRQIIWIFQKNNSSLDGYSLVKDRDMVLLHSFEAMSAAPVFSTRKNVKDLIIMLKDESLWIWNGSAELLPCSLKAQESECHGGKRRRSNSKNKQKKLKSPVSANRLLELSEYNDFNVLLCFSGGISLVGSCYFLSKSAIVISSLKALSYCLPMDLYHLFWKRYLTFHFQPKNKELNEWDCFRITLLSFLQDPVSARAQKYTWNKEEYNDDWEWMVHESNTIKLIEELPFQLKNSLNITKSGNVNCNSGYEDDVQSAKLLDLEYHTEPHLLLYSEFILVSLHTIYQNFALSVYSQREAKELGVFLSNLANSLNNKKYIDLYERLGLGMNASSFKIDTAQFINSQSDGLSGYTPLDIILWINGKVTSRSLVNDDPLKILNLFGKHDASAFEDIENLRTVIQLINDLHGRFSNPLEMLKNMEKLELSSDDLESFIPGVWIALRQGLYDCRSIPNYSNYGCKLVGRHDIAKSHGLEIEVNSQADRLSTLGQIKTERFSSVTVKERDDIVKLRFSNDERIALIHQFFNPDFDKPLAVKIDASLSPEALATAQQKILMTWASNVFSLSIGRGMFNFNSKTIVATDTLPIPQVPTSARLPPLNTAIEIILPAQTGWMEWPDFHSGVASGLQVRQDCSEIDSSWFIFNQKRGSDGRPELEAKHGGFLLGVGLMGHTKNLDLADSLRYYLLPQYDMVMVGHLLGLGVAYLGTKNSSVTQMIAVHIPSMLPENSADLNISAITRTAAVVSYGLLNHGSRSRHQVDKLLNDILTAKVDEIDSVNADTEMYICGCGFSIGFIALAGPSPNSKLIDRLLKSKKAANSDMACIGLSVAIGLVGLRSGLEHIANELGCPKSEYLLDHIKPEQLLIETVSKNMILWNDIAASADWIENQIPPFLKRILQIRQLFVFSTHIDNYHALHSYLAIITGLGFVLSLKYAGSFSVSAFELIFQLINITKKITTLNTVQSSYKEKLLQAVGRSCISVLCVSLCTVMAGSGNRKAYETIQEISRSCGELTYGNYMALNMAVGILFLSSGTCTFGNSNLCIAALFCSLFPLYPASIIDNRYHLQAFRHLWVLAVDQRCITTRNIVSGEMEVAPVECIMKDGRTWKFYSPDFLPFLEEIKCVKILGPRYWELEFDILDLCKKRRPFRPLNIWIQRRTRYLSYMNDPDGKRGILGASFPSSTNKKDEDQILIMRERFIKSFSSEPQILSFVHHFCHPHNGESGEIAAFSLNVLYKCLVEDNLDLIKTYLWLYKSCKNILEGNCDVQTIKNVRSIIDVCQKAGTNSIIDSEFIKLIDYQLDQYWISMKSCLEDNIRAYIQTGKCRTILTCSFLAYYNWPTSDEILQLIGLIKDNDKNMARILVMKQAKISFKAAAQIVDVVAGL